ncbi:hypothetical protein ACFE04_016550 [Oxalis oulophora]
MSHHSTSFSCFRPTSAVTTSDNHHYSPPPFITGNPNLTTCLYHTNLGIFSLTWSNTLFGHSLHLQLHRHNNNSASSSPVSLSTHHHHHHHPLSLMTLFHLHIKPFTFWKKTGSKKLSLITNSQIFWDLTRAKFGSRPEPQSGFYIVVVVENEIALIVGDLVKEGYSKTKSLNQGFDQALILRREHVYGNNNSNKVYTTKARLNGRDREISIDCTVNCDAKLIFNVDGKRVLLIKRLKWKFRGNEKIEVDGVTVQVSWDVYNWLFDSGTDNAHAVFMFRFEEPNNDNNIDMKKICCNNNIDQGAAAAGVGVGGNDDKSSKLSFGLNGIEWRKMRRSLLLRTARSSSSSSLSMTSSASSGCSSSVMEWASSTTEDSELNNGPVGFSLLVYAWRK